MNKNQKNKILEGIKDHLKIDSDNLSNLKKKFPNERNIEMAYHKTMSALIYIQEELKK